MQQLLSLLEFKKQNLAVCNMNVYFSIIFEHYNNSYYIFSFQNVIG